MFDKLFSPISIKGMTMKNRIIFPAMGTKFVDSSRMVSDQLIRYHIDRVKGGTGLSFTEVASIHTPSAPRKFLSVSDDIYIPGLKKLTDSIHEAGGKAGIQLWQGSLAVGMDRTALILVASDMPVSAQVTLPGISIGQINEIVECYGAAARRSVEAGFDCIEFHCAHTYLPHSFLSAGINHRTDEYGGSFENRSRFPLEAIRAIRSNIPEDMPLFMRIDAHDDYLENGLTIEEVIEFCKLAKAAGVDVLDISRGNILTAALKFEVPPIDLPNGFNIENAARIRKETGMLTVGVGRINTPELAEKILDEDKVDLVVMGRAQLADAEFCNKAMSGMVEDIDYCIGCNQGCYDGFENMDSPHITCLRNPALGREASCRIERTDKPESVLIAGGGIAGLLAAITLKQRGHIPVLYESTGTLGGQFKTAGEAPRKGEMKTAVEKMAKKALRLGVDVRLETTVTGDMISEMKPHTFINAIGAEPLIPNIPGSTLEFVKSSHAVLDGKVKLSGNVVVIGGGMVGMETAEYLAERGCKVTVLEMLREFCQDMGHIRKIAVTEQVYASGISPVTEFTVTEIQPGSVTGMKDGKVITFPCDYAVMAIGAKSRDGKELEAACRDNNVAYFAVGDAAMARKAINATREAFDVALSFDDPKVHMEALSPRKVVFMTGATGTMGQETMKQLLARNSRFQTRIIARESEKNRQLLRKYACPSLEVIWGDMADYGTILRCVTGADYVLHIGAMVSPEADKYPEKTLKTNIGSTLNIIKAIKSQPDPDSVHLAYVSTIAMTGGRTYPIHFGRIGDPINPSIFDYYALSKVFSEMAVFESGLKHWVSIRQTGQHPSNEKAGEEPIIFHQPANNVLEWSTSIESGICMANLCEPWVPSDFWRKAYNLSSGKGHRLAAWEMFDYQLEPFGISYGDVYDVSKVAKYNFHGHYYTDSDKLDEILHFRCIDPKMYWAGVRQEMELMAANPMIRSMFPTAEQMRQHNMEIGHKEMGTYWMLENDKEDWINAFFGSREQQLSIPSIQDGFVLFHPGEDPSYLDHGYDETKEIDALTIDDLKQAARFRGGEYLSEGVSGIYEPRNWKCADGHHFKLSVNAVIHGGHWCPECLRNEWHYGDIAKTNKFYSQVWTPLHGEDDNYVIPMAYSAYDIEQVIRKELKL